MNDAMAEHINELSKSKNPYLLQHKDNPVAWKVWGTEAFHEARQRNVPVLVSIGYSSCHWCHVMAHEVFEDGEAASLMNNHLVNIKVDREEHPEVDEIYMEACQAMNGSGGWPLNVFVDHDGKPFFTATYVPRDQWKDLVLRVNQAWANNRQEITSFAGQLAQALKEDTFRGVAEGQGNPVESLYAYLRDYFDEEHPDFSGKGHAPRFPSHTLYYFLLSKREVPADVARMLESTLEAIQDSGLHDRVGGGFHRYSTDKGWRVPHFEKMLYDNAQLMATFAMASSRFRRADFLQTAENIASYLIRDMAVYDRGHFLGFACAEDADDPGGEGSFYAWTKKELIEVLGAKTGEELSMLWDIQESDLHIHGVYPGRIPHPAGSMEFHKLNVDGKMKCRLTWQECYPQLLKKREVRPRPFRDDKVLTDNNALALFGFSILYAHTQSPVYQKMVADLAGILCKRFNKGILERLPGKSGHLTDYSHTAMALFTAWEATGNTDYMRTAEELVALGFERFVSMEGVVYTSADTAQVFMRYEEKYDHAQPAGAHNLLLAWVRLRSSGKLLVFEPVVKKALERKQRMAEQIPAMVASLLQAIHEFRNGPVTLGTPAYHKAEGTGFLKWAGAEIRLCPDENNTVYQLCEMDRCLVPVSLYEELGLKFEWQ